MVPGEEEKKSQLHFENREIGRRPAGTTGYVKKKHPHTIFHRYSDDLDQKKKSEHPPIFSGIPSHFGVGGGRKVENRCSATSATPYPYYQIDFFRKNPAQSCCNYNIQYSLYTISGCFEGFTRVLKNFIFLLRFSLDPFPL